MEYYVLSRYAYWKYYFLILYYRLHEFPPAVRVWAIFTSICLVLLVSIVVGNFIRVLISTADNRAIERYREKFEPHMLEVALTARNLELSEISALMNLPKNFKMRVKQNRRLVPILLGLYRQYADEMNKINWQRLLQVLKMPAYFDNQVRSRSMRKRIIAFKNVADMDANLKEAVASRYLFAKDRKLQNMARLHAARFGTSYPFKVLLEDPNLVFTEELVIKFHNVLLYRMENGMSMPNFIHSRERRTADIRHQRDPSVPPQGGLCRDALHAPEFPRGTFLLCAHPGAGRTGIRSGGKGVLPAVPVGLLYRAPGTGPRAGHHQLRQPGGAAFPGG